MENEKITIVTPVYNRKELLHRLYLNLSKQTNKSFVWLVVDDGSTDNLADFVKEKFDKRIVNYQYVYKTNGGKHTALNYSQQFLKTDYLCIVDSDDLLPDNCIDTILKYWEKYKTDPTIAVLSFLKGEMSSNKPVTKFFPKNEWKANHFERLNKGITGDCFEIVKTKVFLKYSFPEINGEKFIGEGFLWNSIAREFDAIYINEVLYYCDYLSDGLTKSGIKMRISNPIGGMLNSKMFFYHDKKRKYKLSIVIKKSLLFVCYGKFAGFSRKQIIEKCDGFFAVKLLYPFGFILFLRWRKKYG